MGMATQQFDPMVQERIDGILKTVRDPESGLPIGELNLVRRVRVSDLHRKVYLDVPFDEHTPGCLACAGIAMTIVMGIRRELKASFESAFPGYDVEYI
jgi:metal-sulfur cluster biosynthetic enzyme